MPLVIHCLLYSYLQRESVTKGRNLYFRAGEALSRDDLPQGTYANTVNVTYLIVKRSEVMQSTIRQSSKGMESRPSVAQFGAKYKRDHIIYCVLLHIQRRIEDQMNHRPLVSGEALIIKHCIPETEGFCLESAFSLNTMKCSP